MDSTLAQRIAVLEDNVQMIKIEMQSTSVFTKELIKGLKGEPGSAGSSGERGPIGQRGDRGQRGDVGAQGADLRAPPPSPPKSFTCWQVFCGAI
jgi:hypothetical protein